MVIGNFETGEILDIASFRTKKQNEAYRRKKEVERYSNYNCKQYFNADQMKISEYIQNNKIDYSIFGASLVLASYLTWNNSKLPFSKMEDFSKAFNVSRRSSVTIIKGLLDTGMISKYKNSYLLNQNIFVKGKIDTNRYVKGYSLHIRDLVKSLTLSQIGMIFFVIPYVAYGTNYLVRNPDESDDNKLEAISIQELADDMGITAAQLRSKILGIKAKLNGCEMYIFGRVIMSSKKKAIIVNPEIIDRRMTKTDKCMFKVE